MGASFLNTSSNVNSYKFEYTYQPTNYNSLLRLSASRKADIISYRKYLGMDLPTNWNEWTEQQGIDETVQLSAILSLQEDTVSGQCLGDYLNELNNREP